MKLLLPFFRPSIFNPVVSDRNFCLKKSQRVNDGQLEISWTQLINYFVKIKRESFDFNIFFAYLKPVLHYIWAFKELCFVCANLEKNLQNIIWLMWRSAGFFLLKISEKRVFQKHKYHRFVALCSVNLSHFSFHKCQFHSEEVEGGVWKTIQILMLFHFETFTFYFALLFSKLFVMTSCQNSPIFTSIFIKFF